MGQTLRDQLEQTNMRHTMGQTLRDQLEQTNMRPTMGQTLRNTIRTDKYSVKLDTTNNEAYNQNRQTIRHTIRTVE